MNFLNTLFDKKKSIMRITFSKRQNIWKVYLGGNLLYLGEKKACQRYMINMESSSKNQSFS